MSPAWPAGSATGIGPLPGTDPLDATKLVLDELASFPHLPELPDRGAGADPVGRSAALLVDLHVELASGRWRLVPRPTPEERRARELLDRDLEALEQAASRYQGPFKVQLLGPWTLATHLELPGGERAVVDPAAVSDLADSLAEGLGAHVAGVRQRVPGSDRVLAELDESMLARVMAGGVPSASGWGRYPAVEDPDALLVEATVLGAVEDAGVRFRLDGPVDLARRAGADFLCLGAAALGTEGEDDLGEALEAGVGLLAGLVAPDDDGRADLDDLAGPVRGLWRRLGLDFGRLPHQVVVTPSAGLEGVVPEQAAAVLRRCTQLAGLLVEEPEEVTGRPT